MHPCALRADPWLKAQESGPCCIFQCLNKEDVFVPSVCIIIMLFASTKMSICFRFSLLNEAIYSFLIFLLLFSVFFMHTFLMQSFACA